MRIPANARCKQCGYALRGLSDHRCPECGRPFNPADKRTLKVRRWQAPRFLCGPPRIWLLITIVPISLAYLWHTSVPPGVGAMFETPCVAYFLIPVLVGYVLSRVVATTCSSEAREQSSRHVSQLFVAIRWSVIPFCVALVVLAFVTEWPLRLRFALSRSALDEFVAARVARVEQSFTPQRIGLFRVERVDAPRLGVFRLQTGVDLFDAVGLIYHPGRSEIPEPGFRLSEDWSCGWLE